jgi:hypothetical protein
VGQELVVPIAARPEGLAVRHLFLQYTDAFGMSTSHFAIINRATYVDADYARIDPVGELDFFKNSMEMHNNTTGKERTFIRLELAISWHARELKKPLGGRGDRAIMDALILGTKKMVRKMNHMALI